MTGEEFDRVLEEKTKDIESEVIRRFLPDPEKLAQELTEIADAMNYSVLAGGKRLRPLLMQEVFFLFSGEADGRLERFMAAMELIHTYSLVHDDLPAMDNDEYRRGRETTWKVYGDAMGILTGDALLNYAFETIAGAFFCEPCTEEAYRRTAEAMRLLANRAGIFGMIGGQVADIRAEKRPGDLTEAELLFIHENKTAALIEASMGVGAILGGALGEQLRQVLDCARRVGVAFQIQDDILDVVGDSRELGKKVGSDAANGKQTFVTLKGVEESAAQVERLSKEALSILESLPGDHVFLEELIKRLIHRRS